MSDSQSLRGRDSPLSQRPSSKPLHGSSPHLFLSSSHIIHFTGSSISSSHNVTAPLLVVLLMSLTSIPCYSLQWSILSSVMACSFRFTPPSVSSTSRIPISGDLWPICWSVTLALPSSSLPFWYYPPEKCGSFRQPSWIFPIRGSILCPAIACVCIILGFQLAVYPMTSASSELETHCGQAGGQPDSPSI